MNMSRFFAPALLMGSLLLVASEANAAGMPPVPPNQQQAMMPVQGDYGWQPNMQAMPQPPVAQQMPNNYWWTPSNMPNPNMQMMPPPPPPHHDPNMAPPPPPHGPKHLGSKPQGPHHGSMVCPGMANKPGPKKCAMAERARKCPVTGIDMKIWRTLTPEQRTKYRAIVQEFKPKMVLLKDQIFVSHEVLKAARNGNNVDLSAVRNAASEFIKLKRQLADMRMELRKKVEKELNLPKPDGAEVGMFEEDDEIISVAENTITD